MEKNKQGEKKIMAAPKGNKNAVGNEGGRPPTYSNPIELQEKVDEYFESAKELEVPVTICGLAYFLGFESRQSFYDYEKTIEFSYIIKRARLRIEINYEQNIQMNNAAGSIFALKNMGWTDKSEVDHNVTIPQLPNILLKKRDD